MKRIKKVLCGILSATMLITSTVVPVMAEAEDLEYNNVLLYTINDNRTEITIKKGSSEAGSIDIPKEINGIPVTTIAANAFAGRSALKSVTIPDSVKSIGVGAFSYCSGLTSIIIPDSVTRIDALIFSGCENLASVKISNNITIIPEFTFEYCAKITDVSIPDGVTNINRWAFADCTGLTNITIPKSVTTFEDSAFDGCTSLKNIYYAGNETEWKNIIIGDRNDAIKNASVKYSSGSSAPQASTETPVAPASQSNNTGISVYINGNPVTFDVPPQIINDRTMVPLRAIFEALGASVDWNQETRTVTSIKNGTAIKLTIDSNTMYVNNNTVTLDSPACIVDDRTLVPVRAISEAYNATVEWNGDIKRVDIYTTNTPSVEPVEETHELTQNDISITLRIPTNGGNNWYAEIDVQNNSDSNITFPAMASINGKLCMGNGNNNKAYTIAAGERKRLTYYTSVLHSTTDKSMYLDNNSIGYIVITYKGTQYYAEYGVNGITTFYKGNVNGPA